MDSPTSFHMDGPTDKSCGLRINPADSGLRTLKEIAKFERQKGSQIICLRHASQEFRLLFANSLLMKRRTFSRFETLLSQIL